MDQPFKKHQIQAFSLIELAIVLAIIGLLAGGVMGGAAYLKTAQQKTVLNEGKYYLNALKQFETKYEGALPGDMGNASDYWTGATNGNGNGVLCYDTPDECFSAFKHLQLAGFISGNYTGVAGPAGPFNAILGTNVPELSIEGVSGYYDTLGIVGAADLNFFEGNYGVVFYVGKRKNNSMPGRGFLSPLQTMELDTKYDDGRASTGWIRNGKNATCTVVATGEYTNSATPDQCTLMLLQQ